MPLLWEKLQRFEVSDVRCVSSASGWTVQGQARSVRWGSEKLIYLQVLRKEVQGHPLDGKQFLHEESCARWQAFAGKVRERVR